MEGVGSWRGCWLSEAGEDPGPGPEEVAAGQGPTIETQFLAPSKHLPISVSTREDWLCRVKDPELGCTAGGEPFQLCVCYVCICVLCTGCVAWEAQAACMVFAL